MEKFKETILHFGRPNANGKVYDANDFETASTVPVVIERTNDFGMTFNEQVGYANLTKNGNATLDAEITLSGEHYEHAKSKISEGQKFVASGTGYVGESGYIREYKLMRIIITDKPANIY